MNYEMLKRFDKSVITKYGESKLCKVVNANMKFVPEYIIISIKNALALESFPADQAACHHFLGWDLGMFAGQKRLGCPLDKLFEIMKGTSQPSCTTVCREPDSHFREYWNENKCYPIGQVFTVFLKISLNAANRLLDASLVEDVSKQIVETESAETLQIFSLPVTNRSILNWIFKKKEFNVLLVNFDWIQQNERELTISNTIVNERPECKNLIDNLEKNFDYTRLKKSFDQNILNWEDYVNQAFKNANVIITIFSNEISNSIKRWSLTDDTQPHSINSINSLDSMKPIETYQAVDLEKDHVFLWNSLLNSQKVKIGISFECELITFVTTKFPIAFVLPKEMQKLLFLLNEMRKQ